MATQDTPDAGAKQNYRQMYTLQLPVASQLLL